MTAPYETPSGSEQPWLFDQARHPVDLLGPDVRRTRWPPRSWSHGQYEPPGESAHAHAWSDGWYAT